MAMDKSNLSEADKTPTQELSCLLNARPRPAKLVCDQSTVYHLREKPDTVGSSIDAKKSEWIQECSHCRLKYLVLDVHW